MLIFPRTKLFIHLVLYSHSENFALSPKEKITHGFELIDTLRGTTQNN